MAGYNPPSYADQVLSALLPGLRGVRSPLVTGCLYLLNAWLLLGPQLWPPAADNVFIRRLRELGTLLGPSVSLAGLAFLAYLVGSLLSVSRLPRITGQGAWATYVPEAFQEPSTTLSDDVHRLLREVVEERPSHKVTAVTLLESGAMGQDFTRTLLENAAHFNLGNKTPGEFVDLSPKEKLTRVEADGRLPLHDVLSVWLRNEFDVLAVRMQIERQALYDDYDRLRSEAELRFSIFVPLIILVGVMIWLWSPVTLLGIVVPFVLLRQGIREQRSAEEKVWQALATGLIQSPTIERLRQVVLN